jgi:hypothetical protein
MPDAATLPRTFREVQGWREGFKSAAQRLDEVRTTSLFSLQDELCGERVRAFTLTDWLVLDQANNPFVAGGPRTVAHAANIVWILSPWFRRNSCFARFLRRVLFFRIMCRYRFNEGAIIDAVESFVDDAFIDSPGRFAKGKSAGPSAVNWPRKSFAVELCGEIMKAFPSLTFDALRTMPLAQFWQWLHEARAQMNPEYRNYTLTDAVNTAAMAELNRLKKAA